MFDLLIESSHDPYQRSGADRPRFFDVKTLLVGAGAVKSCARHEAGYMLMRKSLFVMILLLVAMNAKSQKVEQSIEAYGGVSIDNNSKYSLEHRTR